MQFGKSGLSANSVTFLRAGPNDEDGRGYIGEFGATA